MFNLVGTLRNKVPTYLLRIFKMKQELTSVTMEEYYNGYNAGEVAGFPADIAKKLVKSKRARYTKDVVEDKVEKDAAPEVKREAKVMLEVAELMDGTVDAIKAELDLKTSDGFFLYGVSYLEPALDHESLGKARNGLMEYLGEQIEERAPSKDE